VKHCPNRDRLRYLPYSAIAEFLDAATHCSDCGAALTDGEAPRPPTPQFRELVTIYFAANPIQAHLIRWILEQEEIPVHLRGESLVGTLGELPSTVVEVDVQVPAEFAVRARDLALQFERREPSDDSGP